MMRQSIVFLKPLCAAIILANCERKSSMEKGAVVITGASTGIGASTAEYLVRQGYQVFGSVRRAPDGDALRNQLGDAFTPLIFDVTDGEALAAGAADVARALDGTTLADLVNNAGIAVGGPCAMLPLDEFRHQLEVNLIGAIAVIQAFLPLLGTDRERRGKPGRIVNVSSGVAFHGALQRLQAWPRGDIGEPPARADVVRHRCHHRRARRHRHSDLGQNGGA